VSINLSTNCQLVILDGYTYGCPVIPVSIYIGPIATELRNLYNGYDDDDDDDDDGGGD
jgi:hypothetical protein